MLGLFGTLGLGQRALQTQRQGVEVAGQNLANVNNPAYARQRLVVASSLSIPSAVGPQGTGVEAVAIQQLRSALVDSQMQTEVSVSGFWESQQMALQYAQADLGQQINSADTSADGTTATGSGTGQYSIAQGLSDLFNGFQTVATSPTSMAERQVLMMKAQTLATQFNQVDARLGQLNTFLNESVTHDVSSANRLLGEVAKLNDQIYKSELGASGVANDLRDTRQQKLEQLSKFVNIQTTAQSNGMVDVAIAGQNLVTGNTLADNLQAYDPGTGQLLVRTQSGAVSLTLTGGSIQGSVDARDGDVKKLRDSLNTLAAGLITTVNSVHAAGYNLNGVAGNDFFTGTNAGDINVNGLLLNNPALVQASGSTTAVGDNTTMLALSQLANQPQAGLSNQTFSQSYGQTVATLGQALSSVNNQQADQQVVQNLLQKQRDSYSGVSLDEEMTNLIKYQKAFEASARLINTIDEMLDTVLSLKR